MYSLVGSSAPQNDRRDPFPAQQSKRQKAMTEEAKTPASQAKPWHTGRRHPPHVKKKEGIHPTHTAPIVLARSSLHKAEAREAPPCTLPPPSTSDASSETPISIVGFHLASGGGGVGDRRRRAGRGMPTVPRPTRQPPFPLLCFVFLDAAVLGVFSFRRARACLRCSVQSARASGALLLLFFLAAP
jgi:hypothetical protein